jgi:hypothetical protein
VNIFCRGEQNGQGADDLARNQDRSKVVQQVWRDALTKLCLDRQMPWQGACASNVHARESSSRTMVSLQNCAGQIPVRQEGTGAQNLAGQSCQQRCQRIDLQQADGRLQSQAQSQVPGVKLTGTVNFEQLDSECLQLLERSSGQRAKIANVDNEDKSTIGLRSLESQDNPIRSPVEAHDDFAKPTTELVTNGTDLSARESRTPASCDATRRTHMDTFSAWQCLVISKDEDDDENDSEIPFTVAVRTTRELHRTGYVLAADEP